MPSATLLSTVCTLCVAASVACSTGDPPAPPTATLQVLSGDGQSGDPATSLPEPIRVRLLASDGRPMVSAPVTFAVDAGGGRVGDLASSPTLLRVTTLTNTEGVAGAYWELGDSLQAQAVKVSAAAAASTATFLAVSIRKIFVRHLRNNYGASAGDTLLVRIAVEAFGSDSQPIANARVTWSIDDPGSQLISSDTLTDRRGIATTNLRAATTPRLSRVSATVRSGAASSLVVIGAGPAARLVLGRSSVVLPMPLTHLGIGPIQAFDRFGNAIPVLSAALAVDDTTVAVAFRGGVQGREPGRTVLTVRTEGLSQTVPVTVLSWVEPAVEDGQPCALDRDGGAYCWLRNSDSLGFSRISPDTVRQLSVLAPSIGCSLDVGRVARCWGGNEFGQLGGSITDRSRPRSDPARVAGTIAWDAISLGRLHACGLSAAGAPYCWGHHDYLGTGPVAPARCVLDSPCAPAPVAVAGGHTFRSIAAGAYHTCGVTTPGQVWCWGRSTLGALGSLASGPCAEPGEVCAFSPQRVFGLPLMESVAAGWYHTCGIAVGGQAWCWGYRAFGALGDGTISSGSTTTPVAVAGNHTFRSVIVSPHQSCALTTAGAAYCWGGRTNLVPKPMLPEYRFSRIATTHFNDVVCGTTASGAVRCWDPPPTALTGNGT